MRLAQHPSGRDRDAQKLSYSHSPPEQSIEDRSPRMLEYQRQEVAVARRFDWARRPGGIQVGPKNVFVFESIDAGEQDICCRG